MYREGIKVKVEKEVKYLNLLVGGVIHLWNTCSGSADDTGEYSVCRESPTRY